VLLQKRCGNRNRRHVSCPVTHLVAFSAQLQVFPVLRNVNIKKCNTGSSERERERRRSAAWRFVLITANCCIYSAHVMF
jgi:hypothetical protein